MRTRYFYLMNDNKAVNKVDLMDVNRLAKFAVTLEPISCDSKVAGYYMALREHMNNNHDNILFDCYNLLISYKEGIELLYQNIHFYVFNNSFITGEKPTSEDIEAFNIVVNDYHRILNENFDTFRNRFENDKTKSR